MRLIDADALFEQFESHAWYDNADRDEIAEELLLNAPTIDAEPVRHGEWQWREEKALGQTLRIAYCTACNRTMNPNHYGLPHCPLCGARMHQYEH